MKIMYFKGEHPNFGDELNPWMWPKIIPDFFDNDEKTFFIGIGSMIGEKFSETAKKIVFGAGFVRQYNDGIPDISGPDWDIRFVRGPRTARALNISADLAVGDLAILLRTLIGTQKKTPDVISFMPHWESMDKGNWPQVCKLADISLIDPRQTVDEVIAQLLKSRLVITEAMHGAIVADALRIPWVPVQPINGRHRDKWFDWAEALKIDLHQHRLWPSSLKEASTHHPEFNNRLNSVLPSPVLRLIDKTAVQLAAHRLVGLSKIHPYLSEDREIDRVTEIMLEKVEKLRRDFKGNQA